MKHSGFRTVLLSVLIIIIPVNIIAQNKPAYQLFNSKGKRISYGKMLNSLKKADLLFFGELHNNSIAHWMQFEVTNDLLIERKLTLGAEMFEADNQETYNKYLTGKLDDKALSTEARLWPNFKTDYKPLLDIAKNNGFNFIATNVPRRYASLVYKNGAEALDSLSTEEKAWMAPLPFAYDSEVACYKNMLSMGGGHGGDNLPKAQALKDATMAYFILKNYNKGDLFVHYNGSYHSDNHEGIIWHIKLTQPTLKILSIATVTQSQLKKLDEEHIGKADFILCVDENMTTTY